MDPFWSISVTQEVITSLTSITVIDSFWFLFYFFCFFFELGCNCLTMLCQFTLYRKVNQSYVHTCVHAQLRQSCPTLCNPMDSSPPDSSVHGILQARIPEWVAMPSSRGFSQPRDGTSISQVSCTGMRVLYHLGSPQEQPSPSFLRPPHHHPSLLGVPGGGGEQAVSSWGHLGCPGFLQSIFSCSILGTSSFFFVSVKV